jgi:hypothetical protein
LKGFYYAKTELQINIFNCSGLRVAILAVTLSRGSAPADEGIIKPGFRHAIKSNTVLRAFLREM